MFPLLLFAVVLPIYRSISVVLFTLFLPSEKPADRLLTPIVTKHNILLDGNDFPGFEQSVRYIRHIGHLANYYLICQLKAR